MRGIDADLQLLDGDVYDLQIGFDGDIKTIDSFDTFIVVALLSDARANESEVRAPEQRRGWIGNEHTPDFEQGSKMWLFEQRRLTRTVMSEVEGAALDALESMVDEDLAVAVQRATVTKTTTGVTLELDILRSIDQVARRFFDLWTNTGGVRWR